MRFVVLPRTQAFPEAGQNEVYLKVDFWDDYSFVTMFYALLFDEKGRKCDIGNVKIGYSGQKEGEYTYKALGQAFDLLPDGYFSIGQDVSYYQNISNELSEATRSSYLLSLKDIVLDPANLEVASGEKVFNVSLLRSVSISTIEGQFKRVLSGGAPLSDFDFGFMRAEADTIAGIDLRFIVSANSLPSTNIHAIIGRNGVGKTTLLNEMISAVMQPDRAESAFYTQNIFGPSRIDRTYFSRVVSVGFSAFDPFKPPKEQTDPALGTQYYYIGLKDPDDETGLKLKSLSQLRSDCVTSLIECFSDRGKRDRWRAAIKTLESDENFERMSLDQLAHASSLELRGVAKNLVERMSSGHAVVLLTISRLVAKVEEKTLVLIDEPESHLHPPLLSSFTRALGELLFNRNGVAIIATHSPVVLQEIPKSCARVITRSGHSMHVEPPKIETFGENVGVLTREVFGLEVSKSGFHSLLEASASQGATYDEIINQYHGQIGQEARGILRAMVSERQSKA